MRSCTPCAPGTAGAPRPRACRIAGHLFLGALLALVLAGGFGIAVRYLWNHTVTDLFHLPAIGYLQAVGLLLLARLLFGGFGHGRHHRWMHRQGHHHGFGHGCGCSSEPDPAPEAPAPQS
jgi:hypothetical protein